TAGLDTNAVKIANDPSALQFIQACLFPVAAPSANLTRKPSPNSAQQVANYFTGKIPIIINGGKTGVGLESRVLDCTGDVPIVLRYGSITSEMIEKALNITLPSTKPKTDQSPKSPGLKYKHYAPSIPLLLVKGSLKDLENTIFSYKEAGQKVGLLLKDSTTDQLGLKSNYKLGETIDEIAGNLYQGLRSFEQTDYDVIIIESFKEEGLGIAVMDRLTRA